MLILETDYVANLPPYTQWGEKYVMYSLREAMKEVAFMQYNFYMHRDLKSDNILVSKNGSVKIADFDTAAS